MRYAETGFNLEIDLTRGSIERIATDPKDTELYLGGLGTNTKIVWDRVAPEVEAFSPENLLIFATGLLCGTPEPGCNRVVRAVHHLRKRADPVHVPGRLRFRARRPRHHGPEPRRQADALVLAPGRHHGRDARSEWGAIGEVGR